MNKEKIQSEIKECREKLERLGKELKESDKYFDFSEEEKWNIGKYETYVDTKKLHTNYGIRLLMKRQGGNLHNKGFYLDPAYNWEIVKDDLGANVLLPTK